MKRLPACKYLGAGEEEKEGGVRRMSVGEAKSEPHPPLFSEEGSRAH